MKLTSVQLLLLTPLPGSELYESLGSAGRITSRDWNFYDAHHVVYQPIGFTPFELQCAQVYGHTRLYTIPEGLKKLMTGRVVSASLSFYAWKINRDWQKRNQPYLRELTLAVDGKGLGKDASGANGGHGWIDATRRPVPAVSPAA